MRSGAIFARGSCRALMWVLALGVAAVLSAGEAAAQTPKLSTTNLTLIEGGSAKQLTLTVTLPEGDTSTTQTVTVAAAANSVVDGSFTVSDPSGSTTFTEAAAGGTRDITVATGASVLLTVTANEDNDGDDGRAVVTFTIGTETASLILISNDDDTSGVVVNNGRPLTMTVNEGAAASAAKSYTVKLGTEPTSEVTVAVAATKQVNARIRVQTVLADDGDDATTTDSPLTSQSLTFTTANWSTAQTVYVSALSDANTRNGTAEITHTATSLDGTYSGAKGRVVKVVEHDSVRTITLSASADMVDEGEEITLTATLGSSSPNDSGAATLPMDVTVTLSKKGTTPPGGDYTIDDGTRKNAIVIAANATAGSTKLMAEHDADESDETLTLIASVNDDGDNGIFTEIVGSPVTVTLMDDDEYMLTPSSTEVNEGEEVTLTVEVDPAADVEAKVMIELYRASGATVKVAEGQTKDPADEDGMTAIISEGETSAKFTLMTAKDADDRDEVVEVQAMVGKAVIGKRVTINVIDGQNYTLSVEPDAIGEADGEATIMAKVETSKAVSADTTLKLAVDPAGTSTAMDPDDYSIMLADIMIAEGEKMGMAELMVTPVADAMDEANETIVLNAWLDDEQAGNNATLTIIDGDSTTFTLSGPTDPNLVEGFEYDLKVTASTAVMKDTEVMIMMGEGSTATADDYMVENIMIMAGETMGMTKLMVKSDDMPDGGTDGGMAEKLMLYGMVGNMRTNDVSFYIWDLAVPALPVIAQLLLAALMAIGGYRRYRRR